MAAPADNPAHRPPPSRTDGRLLRTIALFKLAKALFFFLGALALLKLLSPLFQDRMGDWVESLPLAPERRLGSRLLDLVSGNGPGRVRLASTVAAAYGVLFSVEGIGLWLARRWAEYLTVVVTGTGIPFELWELFHRPTALAVMLLVLNVLIVVYLVGRLHRSHAH
jgi:uncharacterized membrane protein (DUF2068 family)